MPYYSISKRTCRRQLVSVCLLCLWGYAHFRFNDSVTYTIAYLFLPTTRADLTDGTDECLDRIAAYLSLLSPVKIEVVRIVSCIMQHSFYKFLESFM